MANAAATDASHAAAVPASAVAEVRTWVLDAPRHVSQIIDAMLALLPTFAVQATAAFLSFARPSFFVLASFSFCQIYERHLRPALGSLSHIDFVEAAERALYSHAQCCASTGNSRTSSGRFACGSC